MSFKNNPVLHKLEFLSILCYYTLWVDSSQNTMSFHPEESPSVCWYALGNANHPVVRGLGMGDREYIGFLCMGGILMWASIIFSFSQREKFARKGVGHGLECSTPSRNSSLTATVPTFLHLLLGALQDNWSIMFDSLGGTKSLKDDTIKWKAHGLGRQKGFEFCLCHLSFLVFGYVYIYKRDKRL